MPGSTTSRPRPWSPRTTWPHATTSSARSRKSWAVSRPRTPRRSQSTSPLPTWPPADCRSRGSCFAGGAMRTEESIVANGAGTGHVWHEPATGLGAGLERALRRHGDGRRVRVEVLGHRDELAITTRDGWAGRLPVHLVGHQALVGPAANGSAGCPRCLARRWQTARPRELRDALELGDGVRATG